MKAIEENKDGSLLGYLAMGAWLEVFTWKELKPSIGSRFQASNVYSHLTTTLNRVYTPKDDFALLCRLTQDFLKLQRDPKDSYKAVDDLHDEAILAELGSYSAEIRFNISKLLAGWAQTFKYFNNPLYSDTDSNPASSDHREQPQPPDPREIIDLTVNDNGHSSAVDNIIGGQSASRPRRTWFSGSSMTKGSRRPKLKTWFEEREELLNSRQASPNDRQSQ